MLIGPFILVCIFQVLYVYYRKQNGEDNTLLNFFDDTININVEKTDTGSSLINIFKHIIELIGRPRNYGNKVLLIFFSIQCLF